MKIDKSDLEQLHVRQNALNSVNVLAQMAQREAYISLKEMVAKYVAKYKLDSSKQYEITPEGELQEVIKKAVEEKKEE